MNQTGCIGKIFMKGAYTKIYTAVKKIPRGKVATYGQIAALCGLAGHARQVGYALSALRDDMDDVPWQRVVNSKGEISERSFGDCADGQRVLLEEEGIVFSLDSKIDMPQYQWRPKRERKQKND